MLSSKEEWKIHLGFRSLQVNLVTSEKVLYESVILLSDGPVTMTKEMIINWLNSKLVSHSYINASLKSQCFIDNYFWKPKHSTYSICKKYEVCSPFGVAKLVYILVEHWDGQSVIQIGWLQLKTAFSVYIPMRNLLHCRDTHSVALTQNLTSFATQAKENSTS